MKRIFFLASFLLGLIFVSGGSVQAQTSCFDGSSWVGPSGNPPSSNRTKPLYSSCSGTQVLGGDTFLVQFGEDSSTLYGNSASGYNIRIQDTANNPEIQLQYGTGSNDHWAIYNNQSDDSFRIWSYNSGSSADRLVIQQDGDVGIGTTSPSGKLEVNGATRVIHSSSPSLYVQNDANSGSSYALDVYSQGQQRSFIASNGDAYFQGSVGIGDNTPSAKLDVAGDILAASIAGRYDYAGTTFTPSGQSRRIYYFVDTGGESPGNYWKIATLRVTSDSYQGGAISGKLHWGPSNRGGEMVSFSLYASKSPGFNLNPQLYEVGASNPPIYYKYRQDAGGAYLDYIDIYVLGGWYVTRYGYIDIAGNVEFDVWSSGLNTGATTPSGTDISKNNSYSIMSSRVGINTTSPTTQLDVNGKIKIVDGTETDGYVLMSDSNGLASWKPVSSASGSIGYWQLSGTSLYPNSTSYNVGIGTTSPSGKLEVNGATRIIHSSSPSLYIQNDANSSSVYALEVQSQGQQKVYISSSGAAYFNGFVGIATTTPAYELDVNGDMRAVNYYGDSDRRLKKNIKPLPSVLAGLQELQPVYFEWKSRDSGVNVGLIAQDVEKIFPEVVATDKNGYKSIAYDQVSILLLAGMQEQQNKIDELEARIDRLEKILNKLGDE